MFSFDNNTVDELPLLEVLGRNNVTITQWGTVDDELSHCLFVENAFLHWLMTESNGHLCHSCNNFQVGQYNKSLDNPIRYVTMVTQDIDNMALSLCV